MPFHADYTKKFEWLENYYFIFYTNNLFDKIEIPSVWPLFLKKIKFLRTHIFQCAYIIMTPFVIHDLNIWLIRVIFSKKLIKKE